jgi:hypothetical protein
MGGYMDFYGYNSTNDVWWTSNGQEWIEATASAQWSPRSGHSAVAFDEKLWIIGGSAEGTGGSNDVWYTTDGINWLQATASAAWARRESHISANYDGKLWVIAGYTYPYVNDAWCSADGMAWTQATGAAPWSARCAAGGAVFNGLLWLLGGTDCDTWYETNDVWHTSDGIIWNQVLPAAPWYRRRGHTATAFDGRLWVLGGEYLTQHGPGGGYIEFDDAWYSNDGAGWTYAGAPPWSARSFHTAAVFNNKLYVMGGCQGGVLRDVWAMSIVSVAIATGHAPWYELGTPMDLTALITGISPGPLSCQWSKDGSAIPDATGTSYHIAQVQASDAGLYGFQVTDQYGATFTADPVPIEVVARPIPTAGPAALALAVVAIGLWALVVLRSHGRFTQVPR